MVLIQLWSTRPREATPKPRRRSGYQILTRLLIHVTVVVWYRQSFGYMFEVGPANNLRRRMVHAGALSTKYVGSNRRWYVATRTRSCVLTYSSTQVLIESHSSAKVRLWTYNAGVVSTIFLYLVIALWQTSLPYWVELAVHQIRWALCVKVCLFVVTISSLSVIQYGVSGEIISACSEVVILWVFSSWLKLQLGIVPFVACTWFPPDYFVYTYFEIHHVRGLWLLWLVQSQLSAPSLSGLTWPRLGAP